MIVNQSAKYPKDDVFLNPGEKIKFFKYLTDFSDLKKRLNFSYLVLQNTCNSHLIEAQLLIRRKFEENHNRFEITDFSKVLKDACRIISFTLCRQIIHSIVDGTLSPVDFLQKLVAVYWAISSLESNDLHRSQAISYLELL